MVRLALGSRLDTGERLHKAIGHSVTQPTTRTGAKSFGVGHERWSSATVGNVRVHGQTNRHRNIRRSGCGHDQPIRVRFQVQSRRRLSTVWSVARVPSFLLLPVQSIAVSRHVTETVDTGDSDRWNTPNRSQRK